MHYIYINLFIFNYYIENDILAFFINSCTINDEMTSLMIACENNDYKIVKLLLDHAAYIYTLDRHSKNALHYASIGGNSDIIKLLLKYTAKLYGCSDFKMPGIMIAACEVMPSLVNYMIEMKLCTKLEEIETLELLGCLLIMENEVDQGISILKRVLTERIKYPEFSKDNQANKFLQGFENVNEYKTLEELDEMRDKRGTLLIHSLLILKRILPHSFGGLKNCVSTWYEYFEHIGDYNKALRVLLKRVNSPDVSIEHLDIYYVKRDNIYNKFLLLFAKINELKSMDLSEFYTHFQFVFQSLCKETQIHYDYFMSDVHQNKKNNQLSKACILIGSYLTFLSGLDANDFFKKELGGIKRSIYEIVRMRDMRLFQSKQTILHTIFSTEEILEDFHELKFNIRLSVAKLLLECGASVNAITNDGNSVLHYAMSLPSIDKQDETKQIEIISYLLTSGVHLDARNDKNQTPLDLCSNQSILNSIEPIKHISLKCICATKIIKFNIPYVNIVPKTMHEFISLH